MALLLAGMLLLASLLPHTSSAHEVRPTIADFRVVEDKIILRMRLNLEAFMAGIDLDTVVNTDTAAEKDRYMQLRNMQPGQLGASATGFVAGLLPQIALRTEAPLDLQLEDIVIPAVGDPELSRTSVLMLSAEITQGGDLTLAWPQGYGRLILRQNDVEAPFTGVLLPGSTSPAIDLQRGTALSGGEAFVSYVPVGFDHILPKGLDHILFVLGLFFFSSRLGPLLWQVSAFTLAHTVTLAMGILGWVSVPAHIVEPLIALSITVVALENIFAKTLPRAFVATRPLVVFCFGLLHGLGFASVLGEFGLPAGQLIPALLGFNVGVELGQLTVIALAFLAVGVWFNQKQWYHMRIAMPCSLLIAAVGLYWSVERSFF